MKFIGKGMTVNASPLISGDDDIIDSTHPSQAFGLHQFSIEFYALPHVLNQVFISGLKKANNYIFQILRETLKCEPLP